MEVTCIHCHKVFSLPPSQAKRRKFCSMECRKAYHRPMKTCPGCGKEFERSPSNPKTAYCSWKCFKTSRHVMLTCVMCGKGFDSYLSEQRKREDKNHVPCCSRDCRNVYTSRLLGGDGKWVKGGQYNSKRRRSKYWRKVRKQYLEMVGGRCEGCGQAKAVEVHHLAPTAIGGSETDFDNLMAVCKDCHANMHEQLRDGAFAHELRIYLDEIG